MTDIVSGSTLPKRNKILATTVVGSLLVGILMLAFFISDPEKGKPSALEIARKNAEKTTTDFSISPSTGVGNEENWRNRSEDVISKNSSDIADMKSQVEVLKAQLTEAQQQRGQYPDYPTASVADNANKLLQSQGLSLLPNTSQANPTLPPPPSMSALNSNQPLPVEQLNNGQIGAENSGGGLNPVGGFAPKNTINRIDVSAAKSSGGGAIQVAESQNDAVKTIIKNINTYVPAGSFGKMVLLSGVDAPTGGMATTNPTPVLMRIKDKGTLANYFQDDLKECVVVGTAGGEISSERVHIRLETISCVLVDGTVIEEPVTGYVTGEDGKAGFRGMLVSKQGSMIAKAAFAGMASGMGKSVSDQYNTVSSNALGSVTTVDPNRAVQGGLATGFGNAMEKISDFYIARANETYPIIEVSASRVGDIVLTVGVDFKVNHIGLKRSK